jgi:hypothetical protein
MGEEEFDRGRAAEALEELSGRVMAACALVVGLGFRRSRCHDCAFRPGSPEMKEFHETYPSKMATIHEELDYYLSGEGGRVPVFFCHQGMPTGPKGPPDYRPPRDERGVPLGFPVCAGFRKLVDSCVSDLNNRLDDLGGEPGCSPPPPTVEPEVCDSHEPGAA